MPEWIPYDVGHWNPGERDHAYIGETIVAALRGELTGDPIGVVHLNETADLIQKGVTFGRVEAAGMGYILGPSDVADGRKLAFAYNPDLVTPIGDKVNIKTHDAFMGRRNGRKGTRRLGNRYQLGQEFRHLATGRTPWHFAGHVVPSVNLNMRQVREDNRNTASVYADHTGALIGFKDWNFDLSQGSGLDLRDEFLRLFGHYTITCNGGADQFRHLPTWGNREIDWAVVRETQRFQVDGKDAIKIPGREKEGGVGHKFVVLHTRLEKKEKL